MRLSQLLDPRRLEAERADGPAGAGAGEADWRAEAAERWAKADASALAAQIADMEELRGLAMGLAVGAIHSAASNKISRVSSGATTAPASPVRERCGVRVCGGCDA